MLRRRRLLILQLRCLKQKQRRPETALLAREPRAGLFGGGAGGGVGFGEDRGGLFGDAGAFEETRVLRASQAHCVGKGEVAEIGRGDQPDFDQLIGFGHRLQHVRHVEMADIRAEDRVDRARPGRPLQSVEASPWSTSQRTTAFTASLKAS